MGKFPLSEESPRVNPSLRVSCLQFSILRTSDPVEVIADQQEWFQLLGSRISNRARRNGHTLEQYQDCPGAGGQPRVRADAGRFTNGK